MSCGDFFEISFYIVYLLHQQTLSKVLMLKKKMKTKAVKMTSYPIAPTETTVKKNLNLEAFRGIMALMVLISHVELVRMYFGRSYDYMYPVMFHLGRVGVTGFFVLSGYLITMSILNRKESNNWSIRGFYIGRIFRIWPLYFLIIFLAIVVLPNVSQLQFILPNYVTDARVATGNYWHYIFFMPQTPLINNVVLPFAEPTWSIGVEEIFYLIIPWVIVTANKKLQNGLIVFIVLFVIAKYTVLYGYQLPNTSMPAKLLTYYRYDCIALGVLLGVLHFNKKKLFTAINGLHLTLSVVAIFILFKNLTIERYDYFPFGICFAVIIAYFANKNTSFKSPRWLVYIGTISYSLYLTHEIVIVYFINLGFDRKPMILMYILCIIGAIILASALYFLIEKPFMKFGASKFPHTRKLSTETNSN